MRNSSSKVSLLAGWCLMAGWIVLAAFPVAASSISQGYNSDQSLAAGTLVVVKTSSGTVEPADIKNSAGLIGIVVKADNSTLNIAKSNDNVHVITTGETQLLVSDLNGPIKDGDRISPSPIRGIGMKATESGKVVGIARQGYDGKNGELIKVKNKDGESKDVHLGAISAQIQVTNYTAPDNGVPASIQAFSNRIAGKPVALTRLIAAAAIVLIALVITTILLFSMVRGAVISIGRNPLAKNNIYRTLGIGVTVSSSIMVLAVTGAYFVVRV